MEERLISGLIAVSFFLYLDLDNAHAARISDVANTKHNFSATYSPQLPTGQSRVVSATTESQICVFCHTPHGAAETPGPLWNRALSGAVYDTYSSGSLDAAIGPGAPLQQPTGISKLCLSCHDGTMAIGAVNVLNGSFTDQIGTTEDIAMTGTSAGGTIAEGAGRLTGYSRFIGTSLSNDHPISMTYDTALALKDGEMRDPAVEDYIGTRVAGTRSPIIPLQDDAGGNGQVQCNACHDPHIRDDTLDQNIKFLRLSRLQATRPANVAFNPGNPVGENGDIICLACHQKAGWVDSAHANPDVADEIYSNAAANVRDFPLGTRVWESACLACHDTHTVQGARRLTRGGTDGPTISVDGYQVKQGGRPAIEQTCYACHSSDGGTLTAQGLGTDVPDIKTDFTTLATRMPITTDDQSHGANSPEEVHNIGDAPGVPQAGADFIESSARLANRHVECTDCHNPHRVIKNRRFNNDPFNPDPAGTHAHNNSDVLASPEGRHSNIASGVLRGAWGVEPQYSFTDFNSSTIGITFQMKRGNPPIDGLTDANQPYVTREYQICLKCHSHYAYGENPPLLGTSGGGTSPGTNGMVQYTNQAQEYQSPIEHKGGNTAPTPSGAYVGNPPGQSYSVDYQNNNQRSWHPVLRETGRTALPGGGGVRDADANNWRPPFNLAVGDQTMYCSDCHGTNTQMGTVVPDMNAGTENGRPWGPHGSENNFILKGPWSSQTGADAQSHLCFKCHEYDQYANLSTVFAQDSGFQTKGFCMNCGGFSLNNLHIYHAQVVFPFRCSYCHIAVPHGWKNKAFLVNLNDVGPEAGLPAGTQVRNGAPGFGGGPGFSVPAYTEGPYYNRAILKVTSFATSGNWTPGNCGSAGPPGSQMTGVNWMAFGSEACMVFP